MRRESKKREVVEEYLRGGYTLRELEARWGVPRQTIHRWVKSAQEWGDAEQLEKLEARSEFAVRQGGELPAEVRRLKKELEEARLYNELLNTMIDIAEDQLGIDIRKKRGAKRSR